MSTMASQITRLTIVYSTVNPGADQRKESKLRVTGLCVGNSPVTGEFTAQMASNAENVAIWWYEGHGQVRASHSIYEIYLLVLALDTCFWYRSTMS